MYADFITIFALVSICLVASAFRLLDWLNTLSIPVAPAKPRRNFKVKVYKDSTHYLAHRIVVK